MNTLPTLIALVGVLAAAGGTAQAAECFDQQAGQDKAGETTAVIGPQVVVVRDGASDNPRPQTGADIWTGDLLRTGAESMLQLKMCDWSTYTLAPESESAVSEFYQADGATGRRVVNFLRGSLRFASGKNSAPDSTEIRIQDSGVTMGIRGTNVLVAEVDGVVYAVLEGPPRQTTALERQGAVDIYAEATRERRVASLRRPRFAVRIDAQGQVSEPFRVSADFLSEIYARFVPTTAMVQTTSAAEAKPLADSGQSAQEGQPMQASTYAQTWSDNLVVERYPEQPFNQSDQPASRAALREFAARQDPPRQHLFAVLPAQFELNNPEQAQPQTIDGVALIQIEIDADRGLIAPDPLASFVRLATSVDNPDDLSQESVDVTLPGDVAQAFYDLVLASQSISLDGDSGDVAIFESLLFRLSARPDAEDGLLFDVVIAGDALSDSGSSATVNGLGLNLLAQPGSGEFAFFTANLASILNLADLDDVLPQGGQTVLSGSTAQVLASFGRALPLRGVGYFQLEVDFAARELGGEQSFLALTAAADPLIGAEPATRLVELDQGVDLQAGRLNLALYALSDLSSDSGPLRGQVVLVDTGQGVQAQIAAIVDGAGPNNFYAEIEATEDSLLVASDLARIDELSAQAEVLGRGTFRYQSQPGQGRIAYVTADGVPINGTAQASIDINFADRTLGGGSSAVSLQVADDCCGSLIDAREALRAVDFDEAIQGRGLFGLDSADFDGVNIQSLLLLLRNDPELGVGGRADALLQIQGAEGGRGLGQILQMPLEQGASGQDIADRP